VNAKTVHSKNIDEYHKMEIEEIFSRTREHRSQRSQIYSFLGTAHLVLLGLAFNNQKISLLVLATSLIVALIVVDYSLKRTLATLELRGMQLESLYAPDPDMALIHLSVATSYISSKQYERLKAINDIKELDGRVSALRRARPGLSGSIFLPLLVILQIGMAISLWNSGWKIF